MPKLHEIIIAPYAARPVHPASVQCVHKCVKWHLLPEQSCECEVCDSPKPQQTSIHRKTQRHTGDPAAVGKADACGLPERYGSTL
jgi:hypothetical protein